MEALKKTPQEFELQKKQKAANKPLTQNQKQSIALVQIGTFLEYFDLYLYIHMAVVLNTIFFPKTDPYTASLLAAFTFSSTFFRQSSKRFAMIALLCSLNSSRLLTTLLPKKVVPSSSVGS